MLLFRKGRLVNQYAKEAAREFYVMVPPEVFHEANSGTSKKAVSRYRKALEATIRTAAHYRSALRLGVYGKAKFHLVFMNQLTELGYGEEEAKQINRQLLLRLG